jgi:AcrR family transcriptional regulator
MATTPTRDRIMEATAELFRRHGYTGTGIKQIVAAANAPFGSIYHHFPGGKEQLGGEVIRSSGEMYFQIFELIFEMSPDVVSATENFFAGAAETLRQSDYADACPIATVALEVASTSEPLREATAEVFESWIARGTERVIEGGIPADRARELMVAMLSLLEGAFIFCRATRTTEALEVAGELATARVREALAAA